MVQTRRSALRVAGGLLMGALGGCATSPSKPGPTDSPHSTPASVTSPTTSPSRSNSLGFSGEILGQASDEAPARVEATLSNDGSTAVEVGYGPTLLFTANGSMDYDWPEDLVLDPEGYIGPWDDPYRTDDGCWRFPEDGQRLVQSSLVWRTLDPDESLSEEYDIYTHGDSPSCLPSGIYRFQDGGFVEREGQSITFTLKLEVREDMRLASIDGDLTIYY